MIDFTVAIPTYNGATRIPKLLDRLRQQKSLEQICWEIVIVDNNSADNTAQIVQQYQANWLPGVPLNYVLEPQQGAAYARLRAVKEAQGKLIGFLDDDNLPNLDWIVQAYTFAQEHPQAGAFSGQIHGDFEVEPPDNFQRIQGFLAIREHGSIPHQFDPENLRLPPAASLVVRKQAWCESVPSRPTLAGKLPGVMVQGDDYEPLLYMYKAGWEIWYHPKLHTYHHIPHWRLERNYLLSLCRGCGLPVCYMRMINAKPAQRPIIFIKTLFGNLRRIIWQFIKYRQKVKTDLIVECEMEFFWGSFMSCFYSFKLGKKS